MYAGGDAGNRGRRGDDRDAAGDHDHRRLRHGAGAVPQACGRIGVESRVAGEGLRHLERVFLGGLRRTGPFGGLGLAGFGASTRRCLLHCLGGQQGMAVRGSRCDLRRRRHQRRLPHGRVQPGGVPRQRQRFPLLLRRGRGTARQGARRCASARRRSKRSSFSTWRVCAAWTIPCVCPSTSCSPSANATARRIPRAGTRRSTRPPPAT